MRSRLVVTPTEAPDSAGREEVQSVLIASEHQHLLRIEHLAVSFGGSEAVKDVSLEVHPGEVLGVAGQSGSGKSLTALAAMGLLPAGADVSGSISFAGHELLGMSETRRRAYRGSRLTMIFQETLTALNPVVTVGRQLVLAIRANSDCTIAEAEQRAAENLRSVRLDEVDRMMQSYPHELSGGMCQRVMIAMSLACGAQLLFADEPTTALDVTVQREVLEVIKNVVDQRGLSVVFISHDLGVLEEVSDRLAIMKDGEIVETGPTNRILDDPQHPYTQALLYSIPRLVGDLVEFPEPAELNAHHGGPGVGGAGRGWLSSWRRK